MKIGILFHDNCFDGMTSAGLFYAFARAHLDPDAQPVFGGLVHGPPGETAEGPMQTGPLGPGRLVGDVNAIVDFRYIADSKLDWWFDHHRSAFPSDADRTHFEADTSGKKYFDPAAPSCAGYLSRVLARDHGFDVAPFSELIHWAEIIDSARFPDPKTAVELVEPALRVMTWIESSHDFAEREALIHRLISEPLAQVAKTSFVAEALGPILEAHQKRIEAFRTRHRREGNVVFCDLTDLEIDALNKFIAYYVQPDAEYAVVVTRSKGRSKVSVGYTPWGAPEARHHDISALCERYGGGGHPVVGAVSLAPEEADRAVAIGREMVETLRR
jgi:hypothetical protein